MGAEKRSKLNGRRRPLLRREREGNRGLLVSPRYAIPRSSAAARRGARSLSADAETFIDELHPTLQAAGAFLSLPSLPSFHLPITCRSYSFGRCADLIL